VKKFLIGVLLGVITITAMAIPASAENRWYAGYRQGSGCYGVKGNISAPSSAPYIGTTSGESSWVSTRSTSGYYGGWVQTGWHYNQFSYQQYGSDARTYYEIYYGGGFGTQVDNQYSHTWGTTHNYRVEWDGTYWEAYRDSTFLAEGSGGSITNPPTTLLAMSEIHADPIAELDVHFTSVQWKNSSGTWNNFSRWWDYQDDDPYSVNHTTDPYNFNTYGP